jgi:hypothetical protein
MLLNIPIPSYPLCKTNETFNVRTAGAAWRAFEIAKGVTSLKMSGFGISIESRFLALGRDDR